MNRKVSFISLMAAIVSVSSISGCAYDYAAERSFGESVSMAIREQTIRASGVGHDGVSPGLEGAPSKAVIDRYNRSYEQPQSLGNVMTLGVGTGPVPATGVSSMPMTGSAVGVGGR